MRSTILYVAALVVRAFGATLNVGSGQTYSTITAAYNAAAAGDTIYVYPGTYAEQLKITKASITLMGSAYPSTNPANNEAVMTHAEYASVAGSDDGSATLLVSGANFKMYNMNITNTAGTTAQAVALSLTGTSQGVYACAMTGWQDTLYAHTGTQFFSRCYIEGAVDFIFGVTGNAWFQGCTIGILRAASTITAQGRTSSSTTGYFVLDSAKLVLGKGGASAAKGSSYLGRPWGDYAQTVFQNSNLENFITAAGWELFSSGQDVSEVFYAEYGNSNAAGTRVSWASTISAAIGITTILPTYASWVDSSFLGVTAP